MLSMALSSKNSSGFQNLIFTVQDDGEMSIAVVGDYEGKYFQLDFELLELQDVDDLIWYLQRRREQMNDVVINRNVDIPPMI